MDDRRGRKRNDLGHRSSGKSSLQPVIAYFHLLRQRARTRRAPRLSLRSGERTKPARSCPCASTIDLSILHALHACSCRVPCFTLRVLSADVLPAWTALQYKAWQARGKGGPMRIDIVLLTDYFCLYANSRACSSSVRSAYEFDNAILYRAHHRT